MRIDLSGKRALATGSTSGIGQATAASAVLRGQRAERGPSGPALHATHGPSRLGPGDLRQFRVVRIRSDDGIPFEEAERWFITEERPTSLLGRLIRPAEIANLITYVASDLASATTGAALRADGGVAPTIIP